MEVMFGSDAFVWGPTVVLFAHVDEVCVNYHPKFEFLNESIVEHVIFWFVLNFFIYLVHIVHDRGKEIAQDSTQPRSSPTYDTPIDEVLDYNLHVQIVILKFKLQFINITIFMSWK